MRLRLPRYRRRAPDPIYAGVMDDPQPTPKELTRRYRREQSRLDHHFWGLVHDHDWLQYDPPKYEEPPECPTQRRGIFRSLGRSGRRTKRTSSQ